MKPTFRGALNPLASVRWRHAVLAGTAIALGLVVHFQGLGLGPIARDMTGDALWAAMVAWLIGVMFPGMRLGARITIAFAWCVVIETSQLLHSPGIDALRETTLGHLVLGSGFDPRDFLAYAAGVGVVVLIDAVIAQSVGEFRSRKGSVR